MKAHSGDGKPGTFFGRFSGGRSGCSAVAVVQAAEHGDGDDGTAARWFDLSGVSGIPAEGEMGTGFVVVGREFAENPAAERAREWTPVPPLGYADRQVRLRGKYAGEGA